MGHPDSAPLHNSERRKKRRPVAYPRLHEALFVWMKAIEKEVWGGGWGRIFVWGLDGEGGIYENTYTIKVSLH